MSNSQETGIVKWFNERRGFGFIKRPDKPDLFVHYSEIQHKRRTLEPGQVVTYQETTTEHGLQAANVKKVQQQAA